MLAVVWLDYLFVVFDGDFFSQQLNMYLSRSVSNYKIHAILFNVKTSLLLV